jgi:hypothetical protein
LPFARPYAALRRSRHPLAAHFKNPAYTVFSKRPTLTDRNLKKIIASHRHLVKYPEVTGKKLEGVEFSTMSEDHSITILFQDKTTLRFDLEPGFTMFADYSDWKTGDERPIKHWPPVRSRAFRE